ncbi:MAG TPA: long-chain fatty acid--CoA ligase, partial [Polyangiaceae bacterium]|nr:long-chain fatty acid--CoA ligase [Polyangiaceae bacterium]
GTRHLSSWPPGTPLELEGPETSLWTNLEASAARVPDKAALIFYESVTTYAQLRDQCERMAGFLQRECGVKRGDRVALYMQNSPQFVVAYYAILRADAAVVPVNPMNLTAEIEYMLRDSEASVMFASQEVAPNALPLLPSGSEGKPLRHLVVATYSDALTARTELAVPDFVRAPRKSFDAAGVTAWADALALDLAPQPHTATPDDLCVLPYTSGTTGQPKGCMHTHRSVMHTTVAGPAWHGEMKGDECELAALPFFHVTGMQNSMNCPLYVGSTIVILPRWDRAVAAELVQRFRITGWTAVPTMVVDLLSNPDIGRYDLSSIRTMGGGGAAMPEAIAQKLKDLCDLTYIEGYGLSETIAPTHINPHQKPKKQCLGIPIFGVDSRVVDPQTLVELEPGQVGEIVTHGPQVFAGYWNKPEANAEAFVQIDGKRFFRTGDLGRIDEEGYFFLVDRLKRMINVSGFKVWPAEVEAMLYGHPAVLEAAIIRTRDPRRGESVKAVVALKKDAADVPDELSFIGWCQARMAAYKVPRSVEFVASLPKTGSGKILWRALQEQEDTLREHENSAAS